MLQNRKLKLKTVLDFRVDWVDDSEQRLEPSVLEDAILKIDQVLRKGDSLSRVATIEIVVYTH